MVSMKMSKTMSEMNNKNIDSERKKFEIWARDNVSTLERDGSGYKNQDADRSWKAWLARSEQEVPIAALPLSANEIEEVAHKLCRYSDAPLNFYMLCEQLKNVLVQRVRDAAQSQKEVVAHTDGLPKPAALVKRSEWDDARSKRQSFNGWRIDYGDCDMGLYTVEQVQALLDTERAKQKEVVMNNAVDLKSVHTAILSLIQNPHDNVARTHDFKNGVMQAASIVAKFSVPSEVAAMLKDYEEPVTPTMIAAGALNHSHVEGQSKEEEEAEVLHIYRAMRNLAPILEPALPEPFGRFHSRRYPDGSTFTFQTHDTDPDSFPLFTALVPGHETAMQADKLLNQASIAMGGWSKRLCSSEDCSDIPTKLKVMSGELNVLRRSLKGIATAQGQDDAALKRDAARYRIVRQNAYYYGIGNPTPEKVDAEVDAELAKS